MIQNKALTPLQAMTQSALLKQKDDVYDLSTEKILEVSPTIIKNWQYNDRPEFELGDIESLADEFKSIGQLQPCIVRPLSDSSEFQYELIVGERRWRAALLAMMNLKIVIKPLTTQEAALLQISENASREDISDYAKGVNYYKLIQDNVFTQMDLVHKLGKTKQYVSSLLSFARIPDSIVQSIGDMSKVSYRTAEEICRLSKKGQEYVDLILKVTDKIKTGKFGQESLNKFVISAINNDDHPQIEKTKFYNKDGKLLFGIKLQNKKIHSIIISDLVSDQIIKNNTEFIGEITNVIEKFLKSAAAD